MASDIRSPIAPSPRTYRRSESIVFFKTRDDFGELSNMRSGFPLVVNGVTIPSSEALYQACRFPHLPVVQRLIISQKSPMTAKMVSKPYRHQSRDDWNDVRVPVMKWCLRVKLNQHWEEFGRALLRSGDRPIVEQSTKDPYWGAIPDDRTGVLRGANVLGRLLMELRERLKNAPADLELVEPVAIEDFHLLGQNIEPVRKIHKALSLLAVMQEPKVAPEPVCADTPSTKKRATKKPEQQAQLELASPKSTPTRTKSSKRRDYHVVPSQRGGWEVLREGAKRASAHCKTKSEAVERGRELARNNRVDLVQHTKTEWRARDTSPNQLCWL